MSIKKLNLLIPLIIITGFLYAQQAATFTYWNDASWSGTVDVRFWVESNGKRTLYSTYENGIKPTELDQDIQLILEFSDLELGYKKGKKRGKDHSKYFYIEFSPAISFQNTESNTFSPAFQRTMRLYEGSEKILLPFRVFPNVTEKTIITLKSGFVVKHQEYPDMEWPTRIDKELTILPNTSLLARESKSQEAASLMEEIMSLSNQLEDQERMLKCDQLLENYAAFLSNSELQEVRSMKKRISDKLPEMSEREMYDLIRQNINNGLTKVAVDQAKLYLMHLSARHYQGTYREDVIFTIINQSDQVNEVSEFIKLYRRDYPSGRYLDQLASAQQKLQNRIRRSGLGNSGFGEMTMPGQNTNRVNSEEFDDTSSSTPDTTKAQISFLPDKQNINVSISGSSNALMLRIVDRISQKGWNKILPPDKETYEIHIWSDQEFAQLSSGLYSAQLSKVYPDTSFAISNEIMIGLERPMHIPKAIYLLGGLIFLFSSYGFYQRYLKL